MCEKVNTKTQVIEVTFENLSEEITKTQLSVLVTKLLNQNTKLRGKILNISIK
jgi:hypothetical protein